MRADPTRRQWLASLPAAACLAASPAGAAERPADEPFGYCLNTSTLPQKVPLAEKVQIAARAGYQGMEPWVREMDQHVKDGGSLKDLGKRIRDSGMTVESVIGFFEWIVDDDGRRKKALEEARRNFDMVQQLGGKRLAAPPVGATKQSDLNLFRAAERYRALLELGDQFGVVPEAEVWGFSQSLGRLGEAAFIAIESHHPRACILPDVYHLYKGGSDFRSIRLLHGDALHVFHFNDYPDKPPRSEITDAARVFPGDGVAPLGDLLRDLRAIGFRGMLSLELFNRDYWQKDPLVIARVGLEKMRAVVKKSLRQAS